MVGAWALVLLAALPLAPRVPGVLSRRRVHPRRPRIGPGEGAPRTELGVPPSALVIVFSSPTLEAGTPAFEAPRRPPSPTSPSAPHVARVVSHLLSPRQISADRHTAYDIVFLDLPPDDSPEALPILRERLHEAPGLTVELAGGPAFYGDVQSVSRRTSGGARSSRCRSPRSRCWSSSAPSVAAGVPLIVGGTAVVVALAGDLPGRRRVMPMSIFVLNLATLLGLGLGVDYSLLLTSRFREELARAAGRPRRGSPRRCG